MKRLLTNPPSITAKYGAIFLGLLCVTATAFALDLKSKLQLPASGIQSSLPVLKRAFFWSEWNGFVAPRTSRADSSREYSVVLTGAGKPSGSVLDRSLKYWGGDFYPRVFVAKTGVPFALKNEDIFPHKPISDNKEAQGVLGDLLLGSGSEKNITLVSPIVAEINDDLHPHVKGFVHVIPDLVAVATLEGENFVFTGLDAGTYQLQVFYKDKRLLSQSVEVTSNLELPVVQLPKVE